MYVWIIQQLYIVAERKKQSGNYPKTARFFTIFGFSPQNTPFSKYYFVQKISLSIQTFIHTYKSPNKDRYAILYVC
jgi:hypothetical protein